MSDTVPSLYSQKIMPEKVIAVLYFQLSSDHPAYCARFPLLAECTQVDGDSLSQVSVFFLHWEPNTPEGL